MSGVRFQLDLFIPQAVYDTIPSAKKLAFRDIIRAVKAFATKINEGAANEEMTVRAAWHTCGHDESPPQPCDPEQEI
uniref:Uncharacterized protein n=1 Tax=viral metagenome TaxID=1070528 RepID=A0A6M3JBR4_9ZZZZ